MFIITLKFSDNKANAGQYANGHKEWIEKGYADGVFLLTGSIQPQEGGAIIAQGETLSQIEARVKEDPFVAEDVVQAEILEIAPLRTDARLEFLKG